MNRPVRFSKEARAELTAVSRWYEQAKKGLGLTLLEMVDRAIERLESAPSSGTPVPGVSDASIRRVPVRRFPYHLVYVELPDRVQILALAHHRRHPGYWIRRAST